VITDTCYERLVNHTLDSYRSL